MPLFFGMAALALVGLWLSSSWISSSCPFWTSHRKYYGLKVSVFLLAIFHVSMALAALAVEFIFGALHLIPQQRSVQIVEESIRWNYTTILKPVVCER